MAEKLTRLFRGGVKPVRPGVYQRKFPDGSFYYSKWDGAKWCVSAITVELAAIQKLRSIVQSVPWRGLAEPPKEEA
jgi:hypothetical protein